MDDTRLKRFGQLIYFMNSKIDEITSTELTDVNLTREQLYMLELIAGEENMTQKKLIYRLNKEQTAVSRAIKKLVDNGYVYKEQSIYDLRSTVLKVTDNGKKVLEKAEVIKGRVVQNFMKELGTEESQELIMLLEKVYNSFSIRDPFRY
ncbi:MarR family winged helix-turn-helix transcriptional regulator [Macrococcus equipercicus]|uniref:MarR family transcriptional regulator n=1 Tax=Macrococcus equipercicus TaxID=69967 RepID=A0A9Q9BU49_9STAP|nr:MarR family transcriptional regulator [Macrococcus equipercicus]KAA1042622.1 MarR family transcriptional regulator [Macrococcus equipercicus]UTH14484.1 MarR family transcriptional regulator [Macrococcus equipercicus]